MVDYRDIEAAYNRIKGYVNKTPVMTSRTLNQMLNANVFLKCENFQRIGAFKMRGAYNAIAQLTENQKNKGVIAHSSGNHAQAVALSANLMGIKATIVMPNTSPKVKINATRDTYGANVVMCENNLASRISTTNKLIEKNGFTLIHPYDNDNIIAGAGTVAYEFLHQIPDLDAILAPVGGGGLLSGTSIATKGFNPNIKVYGVEPHTVDDAYRSFKSGQLKINKTINSIADGLLTNLCDRTLKIIRKNVDDIFLVSEREILDATRFIWERMKLVVEPSGATSLAGLFSKQFSVEQKRIGIIISGGNIDLNDFFVLLENKITH